MTRNTQSSTIRNNKSEFWKLGESFDVVSIEFSANFPTHLTSIVITLKNLFSPASIFKGSSDYLSLRTPGSLSLVPRNHSFFKRLFGTMTFFKHSFWNDSRLFILIPRNMSFISFRNNSSPFFRNLVSFLKTFIMIRLSFMYFANFLSPIGIFPVAFYRTIQSYLSSVFLNLKFAFTDFANNINHVLIITENTVDNIWGCVGSVEEE